MYPAALRNRTFARLFTAFALTNAASTMTFVVLPLVAYDRSGSGAAFALVMLGGSVGRLVAMPIGGVLADRFDRRRIMIMGDILLLVILGAIFTSVSLDLWALVALAQFAQNVTGSLTGSAGPALRRDVVKDEHRVQSISLLQLVSSTSLLVGPLLGAALYAVVGFELVVVLETAALLASIIVLVGLRHDATTARRDDLAERRTSSNILWGALRETGRDLRDAMRATRQDRYLVWAFAMSPMTGAANGALMVALVPWMVETLNASSTLVGPFLATFGGFAVLGGLVMVRVGDGIRPSTLLRISTIGTSLIPLLFLGTPPIWLAFVAAALLGFNESGWSVGSTTLQQLRVPSHLQGRIPALWQTGFLVANVTAIAIAGFTIGRFDPSWTMTGVVACWFLLFPAGLMAAHYAETPAPLIDAEHDRTTDADLAVSG